MKRYEREPEGTHAHLCLGCIDEEVEVLPVRALLGVRSRHDANVEELAPLHHEKRVVLDQNAVLGRSPPARE